MTGPATDQGDKTMRPSRAADRLRAIQTNTSAAFDARLRATLALAEAAPADRSGNMGGDGGGGDGDDLLRQLEGHRQRARVVDVDLQPETDRWDDPAPGVHVGGRGPLPSSDFVARVRGRVVVSVPPDTARLLAQYHDLDGDWPPWLIDLADRAARDELGRDVRVTSWDCQLRGQQLVMRPLEVDASAWRAGR